VEEKEQLLNGNRELLAQLESLNQQLDKIKESHDAEVERLRLIQVDLQEQLANTVQDRDTLLLERTILQDEKVVQITTIERLEQRNCELVTACETAHMAEQKERSQVDELTRKVSLMQQDQAQVQDDYDRLHREVEAEKTEMNNKFAALQEQLKQIERLQSKCNTLSSQVEEFQSLARSIEEEQPYLDELTKENAFLAEENATMANQLNLLQDKIDLKVQAEYDLVTELNATRSAMMEQSNSNHGNVAKLQKEIDLLRQQLDAISSDYNLIKLKQQEMEKQEVDRISLIEHLQYELQQTASKLQTAEQELTSQTSLIASLRVAESNMKELETLLKERTDQIEEFDQRVDELRTSLIQKQNVHTTDDEWRDLQEQVDAVNQALQSTRDRLALREADLERLHIKMNELRNQRDSSPTSIVIDEAANTSPRSTLISHALTLQRSATTRSSDLQRLQAERESTINVLQQLNETVTKYYSTS
jgi:chromosome segregation ATPase